MKSRAELFANFPALSRIRFSRRSQKIPYVAQMSITDCGAACLAMVLAYYDRPISLEALRDVVGSGRDGASAAALIRASRRYGLRARGVRVDIGSSADLPTASILHWDFHHYVVFESCNASEVTLIDPAAGRRVVSLERFRRSFTGVAIVFDIVADWTPDEGTESTRNSYSRLVRTAFERTDLVGPIVTTSLLVQLLSLTGPLLTGMVIDRVVPRQDYSLLLLLALGFGLCQFFNAATVFFRAHLLLHLKTHIESTLTLRVLDHLVDLPYSFFQQRTTGDLLVRMTANSAIRDILSASVLSAIMDGLLVLVYLVLMFVVSVPLALAMTLSAAGRVGLFLVLRRRQSQLVAESLENEAASRTVQLEILGGMETLKVLGAERDAAERWSHLFVNGLNVSIRRGRLEAAFTALLTVLGGTSSFILLFGGAYLVLNGSFSLGTMMMFNAVATGFLVPINTLLTSFMQLQSLEVYVSRLNDVLHTKPERAETASTAPPRLTGSVRVERVTFHYPGQRTAVLKDVTLDISPGAKLAIVGSTGSGKSTLARLLSGLYTPTSGRISFDRLDLETLALRSVRQQVGFVSQDTRLFSGTIRYNIGLSRPNIDFDAIISAARIACIHDEIMSWPMQYDTPLSDSGLSLSGGQRQRIAIARALVCSPPILVLDEATSHLDAVTEEKITAGVNKLQNTQVIIAHRLSTIRASDWIVVLEAGSIVEQGSHVALLRQGGAYSRLVQSQTL